MTTPTTEEKIKTDIVNELFWDNRVNAANIAVKISNGTVTLSGTVPNYYERTAAYNDVRTVVGGYLDIENQIEVKHPTTLEVPSDEEIKMRIKSSLDWNPIIDATEVAVGVLAGFVTLEGIVNSYWKKRRIEGIVSEVSGVIGISNKLRVVPSQNVVDETISKEIMDKLTRSISVDASDIDVKVEDGTVTLIGTVPTWAAYDAAYDAAFYTDGVMNIHDNLRIAESVA